MNNYIVIVTTVVLAGFLIWYVTSTDHVFTGKPGDWSYYQKHDVINYLSSLPKLSERCENNFEAFKSCLVDDFSQKYSVDEVKSLDFSAHENEVQHCLDICLGKKGAWSKQFQNFAKQQFENLPHASVSIVSCIMNKLEKNYDPITIKNVMATKSFPDDITEIVKDCFTPPQPVNPPQPQPQPQPNTICPKGMSGGKCNCTENADCNGINITDKHKSNDPGWFGNQCGWDLGTYSNICSCKLGWTGPDCKTVVPMTCEHNCGAHGKCGDIGMTWGCICDDGWMGSDCSWNYKDPNIFRGYSKNLTRGNEKECEAGNCPQPDCTEGPKEHPYNCNSKGVCKYNNCTYCPVIDNTGKFIWDTECGNLDYSPRMDNTYIPAYKRYPGGKQPTFGNNKPRWFCDGYNCTPDPDN
jgi:hypothetical protein